MASHTPTKPILRRPREIFCRLMSEPSESPTKRTFDATSNNFKQPHCRKPNKAELVEAKENEQKTPHHFGAKSFTPLSESRSSPASLSSILPPPVRPAANNSDEPAENMNQKGNELNREMERLELIKSEWDKKGLPNPKDWPRLKFIPNYDEDPKLQRAAVNMEKDINKFRRRGRVEDKEKIEKEENANEQEIKEHEEAWAVIEEYSSEDNKFEASELIEYKNHDWCVALKICREKVDKKSIQLLVYSYQCGIQRLTLTTEQGDSLGETLLMKYKTNVDGWSEVLPIYSALPSTGLLSVKYRNNKGIELRLYGISNFVDFEKDPDSMSHKTVIWTDALGPIYLTPADRSNIRRKLMIPESKIFAPLRMCQLTVKGEFTSNVLNGTLLKWTIASFTPLIEEATKDPSIGRNLWPARVIRLDDLVRDINKVTSRSVDPPQYPHSPTGSWLRSLSEKSLRVFAGKNLNGILDSAGPSYSQKGVMMAYVVPCFHQSRFIYYEALIAGPPRVVMIITEGRFLNYCPKTFPPTVQKMNDEYSKRKELKLQVQKPPTNIRQPEYRLKSLLGSEEFHFDFFTH